MDVDGLIGVNRVDDPRRFGIVETDGNFITKFIEKPPNPTSNLAIVGVNFIKNSLMLFEHLDQIINKSKKTAAEFQLTDAFQSMLESGAKFKSFNIANWYDCGTPETLISTNRELLLSQKSPDKIGIPIWREKTKSQNYKDLTIIEPVFIHNTSKIEHSIIGPNVSIDRDTDIKDCIIFDSVINQGARIENSRLEHSIIGTNAKVKGVSGIVNIGECSEIILD